MVFFYTSAKWQYWVFHISPMFSLYIFYSWETWIRAKTGLLIFPLFLFSSELYLLGFFLARSREGCMILSGHFLESKRSFESSILFCMISGFVQILRILRHSENGIWTVVCNRVT